MLQARGFFERALARDPNNIDALVGTAGVDILRGTNYFAGDRSSLLAAAEVTLIQALSMAPDHALAHLAMGGLQIHTKRASRGIAECERALALDRSLVFAHANIGIAKNFLGRAEETEAHVNEALRLSPRDRFAHIWMHTAGTAKLLLSSDEEAVEWLLRAINTNRNHPMAHLSLAAALAHLGRLDEARTAAHAGIALNPAFMISRTHANPVSDNPIFLAQRERIFDGMRKAGVPE